MHENVLNYNLFGIVKTKNFKFSMANTLKTNVCPEFLIKVNRCKFENCNLYNSWYKSLELFVVVTFKM